MGLLGGLINDGAGLARSVDSPLGTELKSLTDQLPANLKSDVASSITNLFQADDVSTALPGLNALTGKLQSLRQGFSPDQAAALTRILDLTSRIAPARFNPGNAIRLDQRRNEGSDGNDEIDARDAGPFR